LKSVAVAPTTFAEHTTLDWRGLASWLADRAGRSTEASKRRPKASSDVVAAGL
jgi:hypothetical protein